MSRSQVPAVAGLTTPSPEHITSYVLGPTFDSYQTQNVYTFCVHEAEKRSRTPNLCFTPSSTTHCVDYRASKTVAPPALA